MRLDGRTLMGPVTLIANGSLLRRFEFTAIPGVRLSVGESIPKGIEFRSDGVHISFPDFLRVCEDAVKRPASAPATCGGRSSVDGH